MHIVVSSNRGVNCGRDEEKEKEPKGRSVEGSTSKQAILPWSELSLRGEAVQSPYLRRVDNDGAQKPSKDEAAE